MPPDDRSYPGLESAGTIVANRGSLTPFDCKFSELALVHFPCQPSHSTSPWFSLVFEAAYAEMRVTYSISVLESATRCPNFR